jgi:hypothetical protein
VFLVFKIVEILALKRQSSKGLLWNKLTKVGEVILCNNKAKNADIALAKARLFNEVSVQKNESERASYSIIIP